MASWLLPPGSATDSGVFRMVALRSRPKPMPVRRRTRHNSIINAAHYGCAVHMEGSLARRPRSRHCRRLVDIQYLLGSDVQGQVWVIGLPIRVRGSGIGRNGPRCWITSQYAHGFIASNEARIWLSPLTNFETSWREVIVFNDE